MSYCTDSYLITTVACGLVDCLTEDEANLLACNLVELGDTIVSILARKSYCQSISTSKADVSSSNFNDIPKNGDTPQN